ncbi:hypothetical protein A5875_004311 [Enterococcus sp. 3H8_DIV0648]|nr:hypothetical protein A5875_004311 [Enterococcus sp. 3H8_DIV0648]
MKPIYLIIIWTVCLIYIGINLYYKDFIGRVFSMLIFLVAIMYTLVVLNI